MGGENVEAAGCTPESIAHGPSSHLQTNNNYFSFIVLSILMIVRRVFPRTIHCCTRAVHHSPSLCAQITCTIQSRDPHHLQSRDTPSTKDTNPRTKRYPLRICFIQGYILTSVHGPEGLRTRCNPPAASAQLLFSLHGHLHISLRVSCQHSNKI